MADSRSAAQLLGRLGVAAVEPVRPAPRLCPADLLVRWAPLDAPPQPARAVLTALEGAPAPDRGASRPWPGDGTVLT